MQTSSSAPLPKADPSWRIGIVASTFYDAEMRALIQSAEEALLAAGTPKSNILIHRAPGSFEVPLIGQALAAAKKVDALIGLGIIVEGDTHHADLLATEAARGIMNVQMLHKLPFAFEILYVDSLADAQKRLDKGREAAHAVLATLHELKAIQTK